MKKGIHPEYFRTKISCACGNTVETGSTAKDMRVEICAKCHPFYTGTQKLVDTAGRVERFRRKYGLVQDAPAEQPQQAPEHSPEEAPPQPADEAPEGVSEEAPAEPAPAQEEASEQS